MPKNKITTVYMNDTLPVCPHCDKELNTIGEISVDTSLLQNTKTIFICPNCKKILSISYLA